MNIKFCITAISWICILSLSLFPILEKSSAYSLIIVVSASLGCFDKQKFEIHWQQSWLCELSGYVFKLRLWKHSRLSNSSEYKIWNWLSWDLLVASQWKMNWSPFSGNLDSDYEAVVLWLLKQFLCCYWGHSGPGCLWPFLPSYQVGNRVRGLHTINLTHYSLGCFDKQRFEIHWQQSWLCERVAIEARMRQAAWAVGPSFLPGWKQGKRCDRRSAHNKPYSEAPP